MHALTVHADRFAARGEDRQRRHGLDQVLDDVGHSLHDVLAVVEHDEHLRRAERDGERLRPRLGRAQPDTEHRGHGDDDVVRGLGGADVHEPHAGRVARQRLRGDVLRQPGLAHPRGADDRDEPRAREILEHGLGVVVAADERRQLMGQVRRVRVERTQRRELLDHAVDAELEQIRGLGEVAQLMPAHLGHEPRGSTRRAVRDRPR